MASRAQAIGQAGELDELLTAVAPGTTRVDRDGLAVVHEGEGIVPVPGAEAGLEPLRDRTSVEVPLDVSVTVALSAAERESIIQEALRRLRIAVEAGGTV